MNISTTVGSAHFRKPPAAGAAGIAKRGLRLVQGTPVLLWFLVVASALLAFFVHLLNEQVLRGEMLREEQRAAATRPASPAALAAARQPGNLLVVTRQPMTRP
jgi:hypothetical protein